MNANIIDGKALAAKLRKEIAAEITDMVAEGHHKPGLAVILVGENPASQIYVRNKRQASEEVGIESFFYPLSAQISEQKLFTLIQQLNTDPKVHGILLQLPLPAHIDGDKLLELINPKKDVDGFHPYNLGRLAQRRPLLRPCTPYGIMHLLDSVGETYKGRHAVIIGASNIVGRPMALELILAGSTVTICHRFTENLPSFVSNADIVISATGVPHLIQGAWIKPNATVIDVGIHRTLDNIIIGDVEYDVASKKARWITPVPGGVGPMTTAMLLKNTVIAAKNQMRY